MKNPKDDKLINEKLEPHESKTVEELEHFPFKNFDEFKKHILKGSVNLRIDRSAALYWIQKGIYSSKWQRTQALFLASLTFIVPIGLIIFIVITKTWLLFLTLPLLWIGFSIFQNVYLGSIRNFFAFIVFIGLMWGFINEISWLTAFALSLMMLWYSQWAVYRKAMNGLFRAVMEHEDLLCILWNGNGLNVIIQNGDDYWFKWKTEGGKITHYDIK